MKLHFCEAIKKENLKKVESERKWKKIGLLFLKESYFRYICQRIQKY